MQNLHTFYVFNLFVMHIKKYIYKIIERNKMIKNILNFFDRTYKSVNYYGFGNVDPNLIKYFKTEYGQDWQSALTDHLYKKERNNDKKAA